MPSDPSALLAEAKCYACNGASTADLLELALLTRWLERLDPMANTNPDALYESAKCYCGQTSNVDRLRLGLLKAIALANNPAADTNPSDLMASVKCFECSGASIADLYELAFLLEIAGG